MCLNVEIFSVFKNSLRGFPLNGCDFQVPKSHRGIVFQEDQRPLDENAARTFKVSGIFDEFRYWNYDKQPSENDKLKQALVWNGLAKCVSQMQIDRSDLNLKAYRSFDSILCYSHTFFLAVT